MNIKKQLMVVWTAALLSIVQGAQPVKTWQGEMTLPTYLEGAPNVNPPFDAFETNRFNYPYTLRDEITAKRVEQRWRALFLENEYLKCSVLPDIGGHLYSCTDKTNGAEMFYANPSIKKALIGYRGAWAAFGIEFNFPVSHNWVSMSPVDFATVSHADGSASVWVGNTDRVYGMQWRVELILRPGSSVLEQKVRLFNGSAVRHRFYWWNNAAVEVWDDTRIFYPQSLTASHGFTFVDTWPVNQAGLDLSVVKNHTQGPVSQFTHRSREPYMGVYHPKTSAGVVHFALQEQLPAKKLWAWGVDADGLDWRKALSDNDSAYAEIQAGLFRNQETYSFLQPQETLEFSEYWIPVRQIGGIARANLHGVVNIERGGANRLGLNVTHEMNGARLMVTGGGRTVLDEPVDLSPAKVFMRELAAAPSYTVKLSGSNGETYIEHTEGKYDMDGPADEKPGPRTPRRFAAPASRAEGDFVEIGKDQELNGRLLEAWETYQKGRERFPASFELSRGAGRLAVHLMRYKESAALLTAAQQQISNDVETHYYLGLALAGLGRFDEAKVQWERALVFRAFRPAAAFQLARLASRRGDYAEALRKARLVLAESPQPVNAGWLEVALLKRLGENAQAALQLAKWSAIDPTSSLLRLEAMQPNEAGAALFAHVGADPERLLDVVTEYVEAGFVKEALALLDRKYPDVDAVTAEPGAVRPQDHPLIAYYRGYCRELLGESGKADFPAAASMSTRYVFPSRPGSFAVLNAALKSNPKDATAHFLLGSLYMAGGLTEEAVRSWEAARAINPRIPVLHRNLGLTLMKVSGDLNRAVPVLRQGLAADPVNSELYSGLGQALSLQGRPALERVQVLQQYPDAAAMPAPLVYSLALALAEAQRFDEAERMFQGRFFPREEGGTNVRQVYLEVKLQRALAAAKAGQGSVALDGIAGLGKAVPGLDFTRDGFEPLLADARVQFLIAEIEQRAGQAAAAEKRLRALLARSARRRGASSAYTYLAARTLGDASQAALRASLCKTVEAVDGSLAVSNGIGLYSRGLALRECGRSLDARKALEAAIQSADRNLSQYLGREALASLPR